MPLGHLNHHWVCAAVALVVLPELRSESAGLHSNDRVRAGIEGLPAVEDGEPDRILLQRARVVFERLLDQVTEESAQTGGARERLTVQNSRELGPNGFGRRGRAWRIRADRRRVALPSHVCFLTDVVAKYSR